MDMPKHVTTNIDVWTNKFIDKLYLEQTRLCVSDSAVQGAPKQTKYLHTNIVKKRENQ